MLCQPRPRLFHSSLTLVLAILTSTACGQVAHQADRKAVQDRWPFSLQGEYAGQITIDDQPQALAMQIRILPDDQAEAALFHGGLPGAGWDGERPARNVVEGIKEDEPVTFSLGDFRATAHADGRIVSLHHGESTSPVGELAKVYRESPVAGKQAPDNAIILFAGTQACLENWHNGRMTSDNLLIQGARTEKEFQDFKLFMEFRLPFMPQNVGQRRGNSGVYIYNRYEVQLLDSFAEDTTIGGCGSLYRFKAPKVNMTYPPLSWQSYEIDFTAPRFDGDGNKTSNARISVKHNGVLIHDDVELEGGTGQGGRRAEIPKGHIFLQDHTGPVRFRNIWIAPKD